MKLDFTNKVYGTLLQESKNFKKVQHNKVQNQTLYIWDS